MTRPRVPPDAMVTAPVGAGHPAKSRFEPRDGFAILWLVTNGVTTRKYLWVHRRPTGIYIAHGAPGGSHTTYHDDGKRHWKIGPLEDRVDLDGGQPLSDLKGARCIYNASASIEDEFLEAWQFPEFADDRRPDQTLYLDNRAMSGWTYQEVWLVEPFQHSKVALHVDSPSFVHMVTHTNPWIVTIIREG